MEETKDTANSAKRILVVDDEPALSNLARINLEKFGGYVVREVNRPTDAIKIAREFKPDLILMDVVMPMLTGGELAEKFRKREEFADVPIIFLTSTVDHQEAGGTGLISNNERFLSKPIIREVLFRTLSEVLGK